MTEQQKTLSELFEEFDDSFEKKKKKKQKQQTYTRSESVEEMESKRDIVYAQLKLQGLPEEKKNLTVECKSNGGLICYGTSYRDVLRRLILNGGPETLFMDLETGSYNPKLDSLNPWKNCWPIGVALCAGSLEEEHGTAYYIPVFKDNENEIYDLLWELLNCKNLKRWINHNVKYDALVLHKAAGIDVLSLPDSLKLIDTLTLAKLIDSERFRYGLDHLSKDWLDEDIAVYEAAFKPYKYKNKDYSAIPIDIIGPYACQDVLTNRKLWKYICDNLPEECYTVRDIEIDLTKILLQIEINGMRIDPEHLERTSLQNRIKLIEIEEKLEKLVGKSFRPHTRDDCFEILCNFYGLPVLQWTNKKDEDEESSFVAEESDEVESDEIEGEVLSGKKSNPSFSKSALVAYLSHPLVLANEDIKQVVELIIEYRTTNTFQNLFVTKYQELVVNDLLHPFYNQCVRTGRMSCKKPNAQQLNKPAKALIVPYKDELFVSYDFSQIEYRCIAHYIESPILLEEYSNNPDADFHIFVAELVKSKTGLEGMTRSGGKTLNFGLSFGLGKEKLLRNLRSNKDLMDSLVKELKELELTEEEFETSFNKEAENRAKSVYDGYHSSFPEMKRTSRKAQSLCEQRGYIKNLFGRRRHLNHRYAYRAFPTVNQASAADLMKERMVFIGKRLRETNNIIRIVADVHDEILFSMPKRLAEDTRITHTIGHLLENPIFPEGKKLLVPIRVAMGIADNWKDACSSAILHKYEDAVSVEEFKQIVLS